MSSMTLLNSYYLTGEPISIYYSHSYNLIIVVDHLPNIWVYIYSFASVSYFISISFVYICMNISCTINARPNRLWWQSD